MGWGGGSLRSQRHTRVLATRPERRREGRTTPCHGAAILPGALSFLAEYSLHLSFSLVALLMRCAVRERGRVQHARVVLQTPAHAPLNSSAAAALSEPSACTAQSRARHPSSCGGGCALGRRCERLGATTNPLGRVRASDPRPHPYLWDRAASREPHHTYYSGGDCQWEPRGVLSARRSSILVVVGGCRHTPGSGALFSP